MAAAVLSTSQQGGPDAQLDNNVDDKTVAVGVSEADGEGSVQEEVAEHPDAHNVRRQVSYICIHGFIYEGVILSRNT